MPHSRKNAPVQSPASRGRLAALVMTAIAWMLYRFPPDQYAFYPRCPIHEYLYLECPGCGTTRALSALLHGHLIAALRFNALAVLVVLPLALVYAGICLKRLLHGSRNGPFRWPAIPPPVAIVMTVLAAAFTLVRNL